MTMERVAFIKALLPGSGFGYEKTDKGYQAYNVIRGKKEYLYVARDAGDACAFLYDYIFPVTQEPDTA